MATCCFHLRWCNPRQAHYASGGRFPWPRRWWRSAARPRSLGQWCCRWNHRWSPAVASVGADLDATCGCVDAAALLRASIQSDEHESSRNWLYEVVGFPHQKDISIAPGSNSIWGQILANHSMSKAENTELLVWFPDIPPSNDWQSVVVGPQSHFKPLLNWNMLNSELSIGYL